ncbi:alpha-2-HS-glycoprotein [Clarias gariepinus]|uniref:alpha-2-HS-glycoprotein n=1 Tax=Clarias gariepinus TaxID=13013 RepID=UPI00234C1231|nr:alpha-2-HS-glycoprotein [Clarias gariepinus]
MYIFEKERNRKMERLIWLFALRVWAVMATHLSPVPCDDKSVMKLARLAVNYINEDRQEGYKFALNRLFNVHVHPQGPAGKVYYLDLDILETKCHVLSRKSWKRCDIRPFMETQISGNCNTTILHTPDGLSYLYSYDCTLVPDPPEKLQKTCPDCPLLLPVDSDRAVSSAKITLRSYNGQSTLPVQLTVAAITRASHQASPVAASFVEYTVQECSVPPVDEALCVPAAAGKGPIGFCGGTVFGTDAIPTDVKVSCEIFHPQRTWNSVGSDIGTKQTFLPSPQPEVLSYPSVLERAVPTLHDTSPVIQIDPVQQLLPHTPNQLSSESSESSSSEEIAGSVRILRPPLNFRYVPSRQRREASAATINPVFLAMFPSIPSPFRSCPGASRYTTA